LRADGEKMRVLQQNSLTDRETERDIDRQTDTEAERQIQR